MLAGRADDRGRVQPGDDEDATLGPLAFTVGDPQGLGFITSVTATSSNPAIVANAGLVVGGTGANRTLTITPVANQFTTAPGLVTITLTVTDHTGLTASDTFGLTITPVNDAPTLDPVSPQQTGEDVALPVTLTVGDVDPTDTLTVTAVPRTGRGREQPRARVSGTGPTRVLTVTPVANTTGTTTITVTVTDTGAPALTAQRTFTLTVTAANDPPTISAIGVVTTSQDVATGEIAFTVGDVESAAGTLTVSAASSNQQVLPTATSCSAAAARTVPSGDPGGRPDRVGDGHGECQRRRADDAGHLRVHRQPGGRADDLRRGQPDHDGGRDPGPAGLHGGRPARPRLHHLGDRDLVEPGHRGHRRPRGRRLGANRTLTIAPLANQFTTTPTSVTITLTVTDHTGLTASDTIALTITGVNDAPALDPVNPQQTGEDVALPVTLTVTDVDATDTLTVTASSSNTAVVASTPAALAITGTGPTRVLTITPVANASGTTTVTVTVTDSGSPTLTAQRGFTLTVNAVNDPPTISDIGNVTTGQDVATGAIAFTVGDVETAAGTLTVTATSSDQLLLPGGNIVLGGGGANRTIQLTPGSGRTGTATVTVTVSDGALTTQDTFVFTVNPADPPTISDVPNQAMTEDTTLGSLAFTVGDPQGLGFITSVTATSSNPAIVAPGGLVVGGTGANRTLTITPLANQFTPAPASVTITLTVTDHTGLTASDTFALTITGVNDAPTLDPVAAQQTTEDTSHAVTLTVGDVDPADTLTVTAASSNTAVVASTPAALAVTGTGPTRVLTITPVANASGTTTITVTVTDSGTPTLTTQRGFTLTVNAVNDPPTVSDIGNVTTGQDVATSAIAFTVGDVETAAGTLTVSATSSNQLVLPDGNIVLGGSGANRTIQLTPGSGRTGTATVTVSVRDGALTAQDTFVFTVSQPGAPTISDVPNQTMAEDTTLGPLAFTVGDPQGLGFITSVTATSSNPALVANTGLVVGGTGASRTLTVTPVANQFTTAQATVTITLTVTDHTGLTASDAFGLTITPVNDAPTLASIGNQTTTEDVPLPVTLTVGDVDPQDSLLVTATSSKQGVVANAGLAVTGTGPTRVLTITPVANAIEATDITVTVTDTGAPPLTAQRTFTLTVNAANDAPSISVVGDRTVAEDTSTGAVAFTVGDLDTPIEDLVVSATSNNQTLVPNSSIALDGSGASRTVTVTPAANQFGTAVITLSVTDGTAPTTRAFTVTVTATNDPPALSVVGLPAGGFATAEDVPLTGASVIAFTLTDVDTDLASLSVVATSSNQALVPNANMVVSGAGANRSLSVAPAANAFGAATITLTVSDGVVATPASTQFTLSVLPINDPPVISAIAPTTAPKNGAVTVAFTVADVDDPATAITLSATSSDPAVVNAGAQTSLVFGGTSAARTLTITPVLNALGQTTITVRAVDAGLVQSTRAFAVTVEDVPCSYAVTPQRVAMGPTGGAKFLSVTTAGGCAWSLVPAAPTSWLTLSTSGVVFGNGAVALTAAQNTSGAPRETAVILQQRDDQGALVGTLGSIVVSQDSVLSGDADGDGLPSAWESRFGLDSYSAEGEDGALGDPDGDGQTNLDELRNCDDATIGCTHPRGFADNTRYLAEGAQTAFFDTRIALLNPGATAATALLRFQKRDGTATTVVAALPPLGRRTVSAGSVAGMEAAEFSTVIEADGQVVADRTMVWDRSGYGSHAETALVAPRSRWYLAEGATHSGFDLFYLLQNANPSTVEVRVRYLLPRGGPLEKTYSLPPRSRTNIWVDLEDKSLAATDVSAVIESTGGEPIIVERSMYLSAGGRAFTAGHESAAVAQPATEWFLAEGATGPYFDLFVLIANPNDADAIVNARYLLSSGEVVPKTYRIPGNSRFNIWVDLEDPKLADVAVSTVLTSTNGVPVIVERAMWWPSPAWAEAHNSAGATATGTKWALAEGEVGGLQNAETYILLANTSASDGRVKVTLALEDGTSRERTFDVLANSRLNVPVAFFFPNMANTRFGAIVESQGPNAVQLVVERAMYTSPGGDTWAAGTNALGTRLQ